ncbi:MAG: preprotein translocase subunit YajC [Bacteroidales bacterium]|nr:preprotein translocase subunit YajC [Bacteroidales bacterium]
MKFITFFLQAQAAGGNAQAGGSMGFLLMIVLIFFVMWLFMIRPQQKKQKEVEQFRQGLKKGDKVVTIGGIYGTVVEVKEKTLILEVDQNVKIKVDKSSVVNDFSDAQQA